MGACIQACAGMWVRAFVSKNSIPADHCLHAVHEKFHFGVCFEAILVVLGSLPAKTLDRVLSSDSLQYQG